MFNIGSAQDKGPLRCYTSTIYIYTLMNSEYCVKLLMRLLFADKQQATLSYQSIKSNAVKEKCYKYHFVKTSTTTISLLNYQTHSYTTQCKMKS